MFWGGWEGLAVTDDKAPASSLRISGDAGARLVVPAFGAYFFDRDVSSDGLVQCAGTLDLAFNGAINRFPSGQTASEYAYLFEAQVTELHGSG